MSQGQAKGLKGIVMIPAYDVSDSATLLISLALVRFHSLYENKRARERERQKHSAQTEVSGWYKGKKTVGVLRLICKSGMFLHTDTLVSPRGEKGCTDFGLFM